MLESRGAEALDKEAKQRNVGRRKALQLSMETQSSMEAMLLAPHSLLVPQTKAHRHQQHVPLRLPVSGISFISMVFNSTDKL
jgi:hypothetical protein